jgi:DNA-binding LytR/AlgR family response regulator
MVKVLFNEILYIEGLNDYIKIITTNKQLLQTPAGIIRRNVAR